MTTEFLEEAVAAEDSADALTAYNAGSAVTRAALAWQENANCLTQYTDTFFPEEGGSTKNAKLICMGCDVADECLAYVLDFEDSLGRFGVWGGLSEHERRKLKANAAPGLTGRDIVRANADFIARSRRAPSGKLH